MLPLWSSNSSSPSPARKYCTPGGRWAYFTYLAAMLAVVLYFFARIYGCSEAWIEICSRQSACHRFRKITWWGGVVDFADDQWRSFRGSMFLLSLGMVVHVGLGLVIIPPSTLAGARADLRHGFALFFALLFCFVVHGVLGVYPLVYATLGYSLGLASRGTRFMKPVTWMYILFGLWLKEQHLQRGGMYPWQFALPLLLLRTASFNFDAHDAVVAARMPQSKPNSSLSASTSEASATPQYTYQGFISHAFYPPLYLAGPIMKYDKFSVALREGKREPASDVMKYALWLLAAIVTLEYTLLKLPVFAMNRSGLNVAPTLSVAESLMLCFATLNVMWLKFSIMWRFARLWSRLDGIDPPENMPRWICANYTVAMFWTGWHRSFNQWILKYMYIPMGGSRTKHWNVFIIFFFVAIWHEPNLSLVSWGLLNGAFIALEAILASFYRPPDGMPWELDRVLRGIGGSSSLIILGAINLIGYSIGVGGMEDVFDEVVDSDSGSDTKGTSMGWIVFGMFSFLFAITQLTFFVESLQPPVDKKAKKIAAEKANVAGEQERLLEAGESAVQVV